MRLPRFEYYQPGSLAEAVTMLSQVPGARPVAGGTDLLVNMKHRVEQPAALVSLTRVSELAGVRLEDGATVIGGGVTLKHVQHDEGLKARFPALTQAASVVGSYRHQTMGTLAGNLLQNTRCRFFNQSVEWRSVRALCYKAGGDYCHVMKKEGVCFCTYHGDTAAALLVLDAEVRVEGPDGVRQFPLAQLYSGEGKAPLSLGSAEVLTAVIIPDSSATDGDTAGGSTYVKHALRGAIDFPIVGAAVWRNGDATRVAFTGVDRSPLRATVLEEALAGRALTPAVIEEVAPLAPKGVTITRTTVQPGSFKRELMSALFARAAGSLL
ncbi:MAG: FAD binding domain-containing protein [Actinobacteria bacterium]|nr:FAD binding domain-containing protein [Actinomycetota bacterium]